MKVKTEYLDWNTNTWVPVERLLDNYPAVLELKKSAKPEHNRVADEFTEYLLAVLEVRYIQDDGE
jgi:hypothetical protein